MKQLIEKAAGEAVGVYIENKLNPSLVQPDLVSKASFGQDDLKLIAHRVREAFLPELRAIFETRIQGLIDEHYVSLKKLSEASQELQEKVIPEFLEEGVRMRLDDFYQEITNKSTHTYQELLKMSLERFGVSSATAEEIATKIEE